jgi:hypothetical protein
MPKRQMIVRTSYREPKEIVSFRFKPELLGRLRARSGNQGITLTKTVETLLEKGLRK